MTEVEVSYTRKVSPPGKYESFGVGGAVRFDVPDAASVSESYKFELDKLRLLVDGEADAISKEVAAEQAVVTASIQAAAPPPPPPPPPAPIVTAPVSQEQPVHHEQAPGTPDYSSIDPSKPAYFERARVYTSMISYGTNTGKKWAKLRLLKDGPGGIPGGGIDAKTFEPPVIAQIGVDKDNLIIKPGMFVNVWGTYTPWKSNADRFDLNIQAIQVVG